MLVPGATGVQVTDRTGQIVKKLFLPPLMNSLTVS